MNTTSRIANSRRAATRQGGADGPRTRLARILGCIAIVPLLAGSLAADTLRTPTGETLVGRVVEQTPTTIVFESKALGRITVAAAGVEVMRENAPAASAAPAAPVASGAAAAPPAEPSPSWVRKKLKLPAAFTGGVEFGVEALNSVVKTRSYMFEANFGWKSGDNEFQTHDAYEDQVFNGQYAKHTYEHGVRWIRHLGPRWDWLSQADWRRDQAQGIDYRVDVVGVPAYNFFKTDRFSLLGGVGVNYEWRRWELPGAEAVARANVAGYEVIRYRITKTLSLRQTFLGYAVAHNTDEYRYQFFVGLRQQLSAGFSLNMSYDRRHESDPPPGTVADKDRFFTNIGYEF